MKRFLSSFLLLTFSVTFVSPNWIAALDTRNSARILENFKDHQKEILFETLPFAETGSNILLENEYVKNGLEGLKSRIALMQNAYTIKKDLATEKRMDLEMAIAVMDKAITETENQIQATKDQIYEKQVQSQELLRVSLELKEKIRLHRKTILTYLANIYSDGNVLLDQKGNVDVIKNLILSDQNIDVLLQDVTYKSLVTILGQKFIDEFRALVKEYYLLGLRIADDENQLKELQSSLEKNSVSLELQKNERQKLLEITKGQEELFKNYIEASEKAKASVEDAWQKAEEKYQNSLSDLLKQNGCNKQKISPETLKKCDEIREYFREQEELQKTHFATGSNILIWPIPAKTVSTFFHDAEYYKVL
jgi:vacuolar-type H+-ATPase subunit H